MAKMPGRRGAGASAVFVRVAAAISDDIRRGALRGGDRLPSTRALAAQLAVNRNTIVAAYDELVAQGWAIPRGAGGTFVSDTLPERAVRRALPAGPRGIPARPGFEIRAVPGYPLAHETGGVRYQLSLGVPDTRLLPTALLSRALRRALRSRAGRTGLDYGDPRGQLRLRTALAAMLRIRRGIPAVADNILVTRGSQMGLDLVARWLVRPGDTVAVEQLGYRPAWRAFEEAGAALHGVPVDGSGLIVDALPDPAPRLLYVTPHHQYPTMALLSPARRMALLERARRGRIAILEDDYDHEFHFEGRPVAPLAATDRGGNVLYLGTLSKILAPGLRLGFVAGPERAVEQLARLRTAVDRQGDQILEAAVAELIEDGELQRHARKMCRIYESRRDALASALRRELPNALSFSLPPGGLTVWARVEDGIALEAWHTRARARGVAFATAREFALDGRARPFVRLAFARHDEAELGDAIRRMRRALEDR
ncbi:MAG TPA: PLP-dependent aminotransferase family protein [Kofleriaceae bacterium]|nr:PLP-dependent aminotransferase family protein [Kofleriaceae bacterium]